MKTAKTLSVSASVREREAERISAHALGITLVPNQEDDMKRFEVISKERLVEQHAAEVAKLNAAIEGLKTQVSGLEQQILIKAKRENKLMLAMGALAMLVAYFYLRDFGCSVPLWTRMWGA
ncbi:MAG TPA: hypothetical protein VK789_12240 [Bryobacteraceae bacterium]|nr:hypothetical protein [Bryobacteraceae bacterium]